MSSECFIAQPFDGGEFDERYQGSIKPAVEHAGLLPYRVDSDMSVGEITDAITEGIKRAFVVLADITHDNPNVWYEVGYAAAIGKPLCLICMNTRKILPFDVRTQKVIFYDAHSKSSLDTLEQKITTRLWKLIESRH